MNTITCYQCMKSFCPSCESIDACTYYEEFYCGDCTPIYDCQGNDCSTSDYENSSCTIGDVVKGGECTFTV